jgi:superfamily I DNA/RNA helicase
VYRLSRDKKEEIRDPFIGSFRSLQHLKEYAETTEDYQLLGMSQIVQKYANAFPEVIYEMSKLIKEKNGNDNHQGIILSTVHSAKGQEYKSVYIDPDIALSVAKPNGKENWQYGEDINVAYVAFTRAIENLRLPQSFLTILTPKWQTTLKKHYKQEKNRRVDKGRPGINNRFSGPGRKASYGTKVFHKMFGYGVVLEKVGEICTVNFDKGETKNIHASYLEKVRW